ncbi:AMP-binding protein [Pseudorhodoferax sp.]|uniref:AMP-binding protein n=1 Tax=Pseudorhodoferax sp. TaxID=1993553 RepID=UPI002DD69EDA|nr:AMP-binding protein [Pseudorhodoferax sp.]
MFPTLLFDDEVIAPERLRARALRAARGFADLGVGEGDTVALMVRNEPAAMEAILAARHLGAYWCGLNWHFKAAEAGHILRDCQAKVLVVHADLLPQIAAGIPEGLPVLVVAPRALTCRLYGIADDLDRGALPGSVAPWDAWVDRHAPSDAAPRRPRGLMPYTSGTTGRPKGVKRLPHPPEHEEELSRAAAEVAATVFGVDASSTCLLAAPMYHSAPAAFASACAQAGAVLRLAPKFDAAQLLADIERDRTTTLYLVPTMFQRLLRLPAQQRAAHDTRSVRFVSSTGSPCPPEVKAAMIDWWGPVVHEAYASSETGSISFITASDWLAHRGSAGRPVGRATVRILDDAGRALPAGQIGTIHARQPAYGDFEYIGNPEARQRVERDGLFTLGDMGYLSEDGYLYICDRQSDMVISGGVNIYPAEIEAVLATMDGVQDCAVFGVPDADWGEALAAAVQLRDGASVHAEAVRGFLRQHLAGYKVPKLVEFHGRLPREDTGKIFKRLLRAPHWAGAGRSI